MALKPRSSVDDAYTDGLACAICTSTDLTVNHISEYPDFVSCGNCGSAFIVEDEGSWIMYGKIPAEYPETSDFALRQWTWLDAVRQRAEDEREESQDGASAPAAEAEVELEMSSPPESQIEDAPDLPYGLGSNELDEVTDLPFGQTDSDFEEVTDLPFGQTNIDFEEAPLPEEPTPEQPLDRPFVDEFQGFEDSEPVPDEIEIDEPLLATPDPISETPPAEDVFPDLSEFPEPAQIEQEPTQLERDLMAENPNALPEPPPEGSTIRELKEKDGMGLLMDGPPNQSAAFERLSTTVDEQAAASAARKREAFTDQAQVEPEIELETNVPVGEPPEGRRFKVIVKGSELNFPKNVCAHCLRTPVALGITVNGTLPDIKRPGARSTLAFRLPLCDPDKKRAEARSESEKSAVLQAHLISGVVAVFAVILFLISGVVNPREELLLSGLMMIFIAILGYAIPATILLGRANRYPPTHDSAYVLTTLRVLDDLGDLETAFEWRNQGYAELFRQVNRERAVGDVESVADQVIIPDPESSEEPEVTENPPAEDIVAAVASEGIDFPEE